MFKFTRCKLVYQLKQKIERQHLYNKIRVCLTMQDDDKEKLLTLQISNSSKKKGKF